MESLTVYQQTALQIASSGNKIATAQQLAELRLAKDSAGNNLYPRYGEMNRHDRLSWLGDQFFGLGLLLHTAVGYETISIDCLALDSEIMDNSMLRGMTLLEMQEAFRRGINNEYGNYYGLTSVSMLGFLKGFVKSDKKQGAISIIYKAELEKEREADALFFKKLYEAAKAGKIKIPDSSAWRVTTKNVGQTIGAEESAAHRELIKRQAEQIYKKYKKEEKSDVISGEK